MSAPAEWAMAKAQEVQDAILSMNPETYSEYAAERIRIIARAIEAAAKAATERERERLFARVISPFAIVFLDGRNEHGTYVLMVGARSIDDAILDELLSDHEPDGVCDQIISAAEKAGFSIGDCVWAEFCWNEPQVGEFGRVELAGYWEFSKINVEMTAAAIRKGPDHD